jgi:hypothetical protein
MKISAKNLSFNTLTFTCVLLTVLISAFVFTVFIQKDTISAEDNSTPPEALDTWNVTSIEEASKIAGFQGATASIIPEIVTQSQHKIYVIEADGNGKVIFQTWGVIGKAPFLCLVQDTQKKGLAGGKSITIGDINGEIYYREGDNGGPSRIDLYWEKDAMSYYLFGNITDSINKDAVLGMANSISIK